MEKILNNYVAHVDREGYDSRFLYKVMEISNMHTPSIGIKTEQGELRKVLVGTDGTVGIYPKVGLDIFGVPVYDGSYIIFPNTENEEKVYEVVGFDDCGFRDFACIDIETGRMGEKVKNSYINVGHKRTNPELGV